jgi:serine/threonine-protein kinase
VPILTEQERCGTVLADKYAIESILGRGGMGVVFRARHLHTDRPVAIKILRPDLSHDHTLGRRFVREAKAASSLRHPNVVEVLDLGIEEDGTVYQVLELLEGEPLSRVLEFKGSLGAKQTLEVLLPLMDALVAAHESGIVHRDLKPDNIFLARSHEGRLTPTLLDFGIAKMMDDKQSLATRTGSVMGTPQYMAPEQARGSKAQGPGIDIWAIGVIAFECLTGGMPFEAESPTLVLLKVMTERAPRLDEIDPAIAAPIADVIEAALQPARDARHATMRDFVEALRAAATEAGVEVQSSSISTAGPLTFPPPDHPDDADPDGLTELPAHELLSLGDRSAARMSEHATLAARPSGRADPFPQGGTRRGAAHAPAPAPAPTPAETLEGAPDLETPAPVAHDAEEPALDPPAPIKTVTPIDAPAPRGRAVLLGVSALAVASLVAAIAWVSSADPTPAPQPPPAPSEPRPTTETVAPLAAPELPPTEATEEPEPAPMEATVAEALPTEATAAARPSPRSRRGASRAAATRANDEASSPRPPRTTPEVEVEVPAADTRLPGVVGW